MPNEHLLKRLQGIRSSLMALYGGGATVSAASRGREREDFLEIFLHQLFPPTFRFGSGDVTDANGALSGQIDLVLEYPFLPSFPLVGPGPRLYLSEGVAAAIEVKSDLTRQWSEVEKTAAALARLCPKRNGVQGLGMAPDYIPLFVVGYRGWKTLRTLKKRLRQKTVDGILVIEHQLFAYSSAYLGSVTADQEQALGAFVATLHRVASTLKVADPDVYPYLAIELKKKSSQQS